MGHATLPTTQRICIVTRTPMGRLPSALRAPPQRGEGSRGTGTSPRSKDERAQRAQCCLSPRERRGAKRRREGRTLADAERSDAERAAVPTTSGRTPPAPHSPLCPPGISPKGEKEARCGHLPRGRMSERSEPNAVSPRGRDAERSDAERAAPSQTRSEATQRGPHPRRRGAKRRREGRGAPATLIVWLLPIRCWRR